MKNKKYDQNPKIVITETTKVQLDKLKLVDSETYDSVVVRLIEVIRRTSKGIRIEDIEDD